MSSNTTCYRMLHLCSKRVLGKLQQSGLVIFIVCAVVLDLASCKPLGSPNQLPLKGPCDTINEQYSDPASHTQDAHCSLLCAESRMQYVWQRMNCQNHCPQTYSCLTVHKIMTPEPSSTPQPNIDPYDLGEDPDRDQPEPASRASKSADPPPGFAPVVIAAIVTITLCLAGLGAAAVVFAVKTCRKPQRRNGQLNNSRNCKDCRPTFCLRRHSDSSQTSSDHSAITDDGSGEEMLSLKV